MRSLITSPMRIALALGCMALSAIWSAAIMRLFPIEPPGQTGLSSLISFPSMAMLFCAATVALLSWFYLSRTLKFLDASTVVPTRVRSALDALTEGLLLLDSNEQIILANTAFSNIVNSSPDKLQGCRPSQFPWKTNGQPAEEPYPWQMCLRDKKTLRGALLTMEARNQCRRFLVNATPIYGDNGYCRGVLASFDDVTVLEEKKEELAKMLQALKSSRDEIHRQNQELQVLAAVDPLSGCLNRRAFFERLNETWQHDHNSTMSVIMIDIDHFKQVNDCYGHATGDEVIRQIAATLQRVVGEDGVVCRYGGEEFCILTTHESMDQVIALAHSICDEVSATPVAKIELTVSAGISTRSFGAMDVQHLLDQADQSLYIAKRHRNRVVCWDACPKNQWTQRGGRQLELGFDGTGSTTPVHVATLNALLSALEFRDSATAEHARRVATLCLAVGRDLLDGKHVYALKVAGLLHDIGKIGVPDAILLKPGPLTDDEWETMRRHDEMSVQIVRSALASDEVAQIIRLHHVRYNNGRGSRHEQGLDPDISLAGRILTVCDAFDAMIADRVYRRGMTHQEAFGELRRCAPEQFDPTVVEALIRVVSANPWLTQISRDLVPLPPDTAIRVGSHVERLTSAIADGNLVELRELVTQLRCDPATVEILPIQQAAHRLHEALECAEPELDQLLSMTQDIVDLCRSSHAMDGSQTAASRETAPATT